ncbi:hypothetical protein LVD15_22950 [Fulvivirga maritima]|uniref:hypothetical protein n=1 Tax=Fulvivirga maritima TaxID=2904247 RepID=UPI001F3ADFD2|nr:hypothetical protein [Fulvivirga maritima]UII26132.1 hypothetical protein LVD15_22950 [Fulvivirga maritima]
MTHEEYLDDLFIRLENNNIRPGLNLPDGVTYSSDLTISWEARNESKQLDNPDFIPLLTTRLEQEKVTKEKINIIHVLVGLADRIEDHSIADFIIKFVKKEKVRWVKDVALGDLVCSNLEIRSEKEHLFELVKNKDWQIKLSSLGLLKKLDNSYSARIEDICLELITQNKKKPHELSSLCGVLSKHGSINSLESIKEIARTNSKAFTVNTALGTIASINGANELEFFKEIFEKNKNNDVKSMSTQALCKYGNETVIDLLIKRAKNILSKARKSKIHYVGGSQPELVHILKFLTKYQDIRVDKLIDFITSKKLDLMGETESKWFHENIKKA